MAQNPPLQESELWPLLEQLQDDLADVSDALKPLIKKPLLENAAKLPLVDKAKLYVMTAYAIESLLFAYLELNNMQPKDHPVMKELERVKQYFNKIKEAEAKTAGGGSGSASTSTATQQTLTLDKGAAGRFIKNALAGNDEYDRKRAEDLARQKANAHIKFNELGEPTVVTAPAPVSKSAEPGSDDEGESESLVVHGTEAANATSGPTTGDDDDEEGEEEEEEEDSDMDPAAQKLSSKSPKSPKSPRVKGDKQKLSKKEKKEKRKAKEKKKEKKARKKQKKSDKSSSE